MSGTFLKVQTDHAAWITFYATEAQRTADASRGQTTAPDRGSGVLLEVVTQGAETYFITPAVGYFNAEDTPVSQIPMKVVNLSGAQQPITVTVDAIRLEP